MVLTPRTNVRELEKMETSRVAQRRSIDRSRLLGQNLSEYAPVAGQTWRGDDRRRETLGDCVALIICQLRRRCRCRQCRFALQPCAHSQALSIWRKQ
jgi:hypothetical protein